MYLRSCCPGFSSPSLLFLVYGFSRRAGTTPVVVGGGSYVRDSVTIYFMAHALHEIASSARQPPYVTRTRKKRAAQRDVSIKNNLANFHSFLDAVYIRILSEAYVGVKSEINNLTNNRTYTV